MIVSAGFMVFNYLADYLTIIDPRVRNEDINQEKLQVWVCNHERRTRKNADDNTNGSDVAKEEIAINDSTQLEISEFADKKR